MVGHRRPKTLLSRAIARDTLPPTLLFTGPPGVGKFVVAEALAAAINCATPVSMEDAPIDACGSCRVCQRMARRTHVDVIAVAPDDRASIKIDVVRDVLARTAFRPFEGKRRVVILRDADTLEPPAQNALLKALEEPPAGTMFVLTTAVVGALLPTVRSRCMPLAFARLTEREVAEVLERDHDVDAAEARAAAQLADGRVSAALALGSTDVAVLREAALLLLNESAKSTAVPTRLQAATVLSSGPSRKERSREDVGLLLKLLASMLRDIELIGGGADQSLLANPTIAEELGGLARKFAGERARQAFVAVDKAIAALERNAGTKVVTEWLAVQM